MPLTIRKTLPKGVSLREFVLVKFFLSLKKPLVKFTNCLIVRACNVFDFVVVAGHLYVLKCSSIPTTPVPQG